MLDRTQVNALCAEFPGAEVSDPWGGGHDAWKIAGKMFAYIGTKADGVSVKTADVDTAAMLIDNGLAIRAPYFHKSWVVVPWGAGQDEVTHRLRVSYDLIRAGLTKKKQAALPPHPSTDD